MADNQQPMSELSSICILQYMDPNKRLRLSSRSPAILNYERTTRFSISKLEVHRSAIVIDGQTYKIGVVRHFYGAPAPEFFAKERDQNGAQFDVGVFADPDSVYDMDRNSHCQAPHWKHSLKMYESKERLTNIVNFLNECEKCELTRETYLEEVELKTLEAQELRKQIMKHDIQKAKSELKYEDFIWFTHRDNAGHLTTMEYLKYDRPLPAVWAYFVKRYFSNHQTGILINTLNVLVQNPAAMLHDVTMKVWNLEINQVDEEHLNALLLHLSVTSFPLNSVACSDCDEYDHIIFQSSRKLVISGDLTTQQLGMFFNPVIHFKPSGGATTMVFVFLTCWIRDGCDERRKYIIETKDKSEVVKVINIFRSLLPRHYINIRSPFKYVIHLPSRRERRMDLYLSWNQKEAHLPRDPYIYYIDMIAVPR